MILIFFNSIFWHEIGHIGYYLWQFKDYPKVRVRKTYVKIIPKRSMNVNQQVSFLGSGIILGMISFVPFFFFWSYETSLAIIGYLFSCGMDFYLMVKIYMRVEK